MEKLVMMDSFSFWRDKKVLVTGHTGFKGGWLTLWLHALGAQVVGVSLEPEQSENFFDVAQVAKSMLASVILDIRDESAVTQVFEQYQPEMVFHLAAQPLVRSSYENPVETWSTNVMGSLNVLEAVRHCSSVKAVVMVTSDKCYQNKEQQLAYQETDTLGGHDPYSSSKAAMELLVASWRQSYFDKKDSPAVATVRAGNVIGGGDWAIDRIVPDTLKAFSLNEKVVIRQPHSIRPWQHVLEPLWGYLILAERLLIDGQPFAQAWNFGPDQENVKSVSELVDTLSDLWGAAGWRSDEKESVHEAGLLMLNSDLARQQLHWRQQWGIKQTLLQVIAWHKAWLAMNDMHAFSLQQIQQYSDDLLQ